ncbi:hypothetical protein GCM10020218_075840 [Dactylosporangium vinaceum]
MCKVRFALRLAAAEHVVGFGERFDRLDQRGHSIDATVFEQYKGQGAAGRTYLPMPFAHVLGGTGWAFHVDTAERTWFNIDASHGQPSLNTTAQTSLDVDDNHGQPSSEAADRTPVDVDASLGQPSPEAAAPDFVHVDTNHGQPSLNTTAQTSLDVDDSHGQASSDAFGRTSVDVDGSRGLASSTVAGRTSVDVDGNHGRVSVGAAGQAFVDVDGNRGQVSVAGTGMIFVEADVVDGRLDVHFFDGSPGDNLARWLDAVGKPERLPDWVFKLWASGNEWNTQARVTAEMELHRKHDIPVGVVVIEAWSDESTFVAFRDAEYEIHDDGRPHRLADFTFRPDGAWPDPKGMVDALHDEDVRVVLWQIPLQKMRPHPSGQAAADAATMVREGYGVREGDGRPYRNRGWWFPLALMPDFTNPEARDWWLAKRRYLVDEVGIDGFKTDGGEHAWGHDLRYFDGSVGASGNNRFPVEYAAAYGDLLRSSGKAPVTFSRAGFTGSQAHGVFWAGDEDSTWEAMRSSLRAGLTAAACGIVYWGWDLAGFSGPVPDAELYLRATALSAFLPIMQYHSEFNHHRMPSRDRTPWNIADQTGDPQVLTTFRRYSHLRERLVPYLAEQAARAIDTGWPLLRATALAHPSTPGVWDHPYDYLLGDDLFVAPVLEPGASSRTALLPPGRWTDLRTGETTEGGRTVTVDAPLEEIPVWCRADSYTRHRDLLT